MGEVLLLRDSSSRQLACVSRTQEIIAQDHNPISACLVLESSHRCRRDCARVDMALKDRLGAVARKRVAVRQARTEALSLHLANASIVWQWKTILAMNAVAVDRHSDFADAEESV